MIKVLVNGCNGKMGQEVIKEIENQDNLLLIGGFDKINTGMYTFPVYTNIEDIVEVPDVIIDFSIPIGTLTILEYAIDKKVPIVIATTGFTKEQFEQITQASTLIPIFQASNMSFDINLMAKIVSNIATVLKGTDIEIIETHHNRKIDSPSGTAEFLANCINQALNGTMHPEYNRHDKHEKRCPNEIGMTSIRGGNIVGEHTVKFFGADETFEIKHTSYSRAVFAQGAIKAAIFLVTQAKGLYHMDDLMI